MKKIKKQDSQNNQDRKLWPLDLRLKVELAEAFEIIHSIYTPTTLTMKTAIQRLEFVTKSTPAAVSRLPSRPNTSSVMMIDNGSLNMTAGSRPGTSGNINSLILSTPTGSRPTTSADVNHNPRPESEAGPFGSSVRPGSSWQSRPGTSGGLVPFSFSGTPTRPQTADSEAAAAVAGNIASKYFIGRYAFRRLVNYGKIVNLDLAGVDEFFRNIDYSTFCYITLDDVYPWFKKKALKIKGFQFKVSDVLSVEERALIAIFLRYLNEKDLLGLPVAKKRRKNKFEEAMNKYGEGKRGKNRNYYDSEEEESDGEVDEEDEDVLFSDLDKLKNCDIGKLMRYLTRKKEQELQAQRILEEQKLIQSQLLPSHPPLEAGDTLELPNIDSLNLDDQLIASKEGFEPSLVDSEKNGKEL